MTRLPCVVITKSVRHCLVSVCLSQRFQRSCLWSRKSVPCQPKSWKEDTSFRPVNICLIASSNPLICSGFSVLSKRFSVIMMSMTSCNLLLASFWCFEFNCEVPPTGRTLKWNDSSSLDFRVRRYRPICPCHVIGLTDIRGLVTFACRDFGRHEFAFCIFGHKQKFTLVPHNRLASRRILFSGFRVPEASVPSCCWMQSWRHRPARCRHDSQRNLSASSVRSDSHGLAKRLDAVTRQLVTHPIVLPMSTPNVASTRQLVLDPFFVPFCVPTVVPIFLTIRFLVLDPISVLPLFGPNFMTTRHLVLNPLFNFVPVRHLFFQTQFSILSFQSSHMFRSPSFCPLCCSPSSTDNSHIVKPPYIEMLPTRVGFCVDRNCLAACSHAGAVHSRSTTSLRQSS